MNNVFIMNCSFGCWPDNYFRQLGRFSAYLGVIDAVFLKWFFVTTSKHSKTQEKINSEKNKFSKNNEMVDQP